MGNVKKTYKPKEDKLIKLKAFYNKIQNEEQRNKQSACAFFRNERVK
jgi:hypothetical protein